MVEVLVDESAKEQGSVSCPACDSPMESGEHSRSYWREVQGRESYGPDGRLLPPDRRVQQRREQVQYPVAVLVCQCGFAVDSRERTYLSYEDWYPNCANGHSHGWSKVGGVGRRADLVCIQSSPTSVCGKSVSVYPPGGRQGFLAEGAVNRQRGWSKLPVLGVLAGFAADGATWDQLRERTPAEYTDSVIRGVLGRALKGKSPYAVRSKEKEPLVNGWESYRWFITQRGAILIKLWHERANA